MQIRLSPRCRLANAISTCTKITCSGTVTFSVVVLMEYSIIDFAFSLYAQKVTVIELVKQIVSMEFDADISVSFELRTNVYCLIFVNPSLSLVVICVYKAFKLFCCFSGLKCTNFLIVCLFELILYVPSTIFQVNMDGSSWVETVLN